MAGAAAKRYARAIFELAIEEGEVDGWAQSLAAIRDVLSRPEARPILANPSIPVQRRQEVVAALLEGRIGRRAVNLARLLIGANRLDDVDGITEEYTRLVDEDAGRVRATAITAVPLGGDESRRLEADLARKLGREVRLESRVDPAIIGGLVLRMGDRVIDASVSTRLQQLRRKLAGV